MFKHEVISVHREKSFRSRKSEHIVGLCALEAFDAKGHFHDFAADEDWRVENGKVVKGKVICDTPVARCRYWVLEEVVCALLDRDDDDNKVHEFYTRHPKTKDKVQLIPVAARGTKKPVPDCKHWIKTHGDDTSLDDLHAQPERPELIACDVVNRCPVVPQSAQPVHRAHGPDA
ncbi:MAG TPA: hypothetical protein VKU40_00345 [Thermoanaerobaculia bacterium]|nr:hypothetical protein [Thermoanaerobaculia bacterium]